MRKFFLFGLTNEHNLTNLPSNFFSVQQLHIHLVPAHPNSSLQRLWLFHQSGNSRHLGAPDNRRPKLSILSCHIKFDRSTFGRSRYTMGLFCRIFHVQSEGTIPEIP